ncbi:acyl carrier protein [Streptomyces armeniacus]|uniref:Acyl carrier protein n=1 Tax=Streptomyces armeniacus TaxID=83291 RepID=A0A345XT99_9ACTN|nr:acyl carrier protein [Streptomyces armeniacus]AXK34865.1 acyl carrier protein [Streptomyces armeniacus]
MTTPGSESEIREIVREHALRIFELKPEALGDETDFREAGGDSLQHLELVAALRDRLGVEYTVSDETEMHSVSATVKITLRALGV